MIEEVNAALLASNAHRNAVSARDFLPLRLLLPLLKCTRGGIAVISDFIRLPSLLYKYSFPALMHIKRKS